MKSRRYLIYILLALPFLTFSQSTVIKDLQKDYPNGSYQYFYESVIRAAANLGAGEEGIKLTKGIRKAMIANISKLDNVDEIYEKVQKALKTEGYETYLNVTNRGNLKGIAEFFMRQVNTIQNKVRTEENEEVDVSNLPEEMGVLGIDDGDTISALCIVLVGEDAIQLYEIQGKFNLDAIPALIERVEGVMKLIENR